MRDYKFETIETTETAGAMAAELMDALEAIHFGPEGAGELDVIILREIEDLIETAKEKAEWLERSLHRKEQEEER